MLEQLKTVMLVREAIQIYIYIYIYREREREREREIDMHTQRNF